MEPLCFRKNFNHPRLVYFRMLKIYAHFMILFYLIPASKIQIS